MIEVFKNKRIKDFNNIVYLTVMQLLQKNEFWMLIFSGGLLYWLFNPSVLMTLVMIIPLLIGIASKK